MTSHLHLFEGFGVELEYMIVDAETLAVRPIADELLQSVAGKITGDVERGDLDWSNELSLHVIEMKTAGPARTLSGLATTFQRDVIEANRLLAPMGARLMPTAMHPWMDPLREMVLWPHEHSPIYEAYNRIFDCRGHGWANLQSTHINLPFSGDEEFGRLHAAIRILLPILPALAASSPIIDGAIGGGLDCRLQVYRANQRRIPSVAGSVIPEPVFTRADYQERIFAPMFRDIAPHDPANILQGEFLNSRGAIARFGRGSIEIRLLDIQECPAADLAIVALVVETLRALVAETWTGTEEQRRWQVDPLAALLTQATVDAEEAIIDDPWYLALFGFPGERATAGELWHHLAAEVMPAGEHRPALDVILTHGPLARRILWALGADLSPQRLAAIYSELCDCLRDNRLFDA